MYLSRGAFRYSRGASEKRLYRGAATGTAPRSNPEAQLTFGAEVVHQNDLLEEVGRRPVEHAVHGAEQRGPHLVHEAEDHTGGRQVIVDQALCTAAAGTRGTQTMRQKVPAQDGGSSEDGAALTSPAWCLGWRGPRGSGRSGRR